MDKNFRLHKMKKGVNLKKCPFCGSVPYINSFEGAYWITCMCGVQTFSFDSEQDVFDCWNTRFKDKTAQKN